MTKLQSWGKLYKASGNGHVRDVWRNNAFVTYIDVSWSAMNLKPREKHADKQAACLEHMS